MLTNSKILHGMKFFMCMIRKCFQVQGGSIAAAAAATTTVYSCTSEGLASEHFGNMNEELELCRSAKGRRQVIAGLEEIT